MKLVVLFVFGLLLIIFLAGVAKGGKAEGAVQVLNFVQSLLLLIGVLIVAAIASNFN